VASRGGELALRVAFVGFGHVGREVAQLLLEQEQRIYREFGLRLPVTAIFTAHHGRVQAEEGLELRIALDVLSRGGMLTEIAEGIDSSIPLLEAIGYASADVIVELSPLSIETGQPAIDHIRTALAWGKHVVTANKGPIAHAYRELRELATKEGLQLRFEGTVMDGAPVFNLFLETLQGLEILGFRGVLNSTTNYILTEMEREIPFHQALESAQELGIAEADPSLDLDGWDSAAKTAVLLNVLMGGDVKPQEIEREGIRQLSPADQQVALGTGHTYRLVCRGSREGERLVGSVRLEKLPREDPLAQVRGTSSALFVQTSMLHELGIIEENPGLRETAYAIFNDLLAVAQAVRRQRPSSA